MKSNTAAGYPTGVDMHDKVGNVSEGLPCRKVLPPFARD